MVRSEYNLRNWVRNFGPLPLKFGVQRHENPGPDIGQLPDYTANSFGMGQHVVNRKMR